MTLKKQDVQDIVGLPQNTDVYEKKSLESDLGPDSRDFMLIIWL